MFLISLNQLSSGCTCREGSLKTAGSRHVHLRFQQCKSRCLTDRKAFARGMRHFVYLWLWRTFYIATQDFQYVGRSFAVIGFDIFQALP